MTNPIRAVFFDLGGTLFSNLEIPPACAPVLAQAAQRLGCDEQSALGKGALAYIQAARSANPVYAKRDFYLHRDLFYEIYRGFSEHFGQPATEDFIQWFYEAQREVMATCLPLREDCLETLGQLRARGLTLAIVSNIDDDYLLPMLENMKLAPLFDHWTSSQAAGSCKPHPRIFEHALAHTGAVREEVLFVGDSLFHDVQGARAAGIRSVLISEEGGLSHLDDPDAVQAQPDHVIGALAELLPLLDRLAAAA